jgi:hypothetical protein
MRNVYTCISVFWLILLLPVRPQTSYARTLSIRSAQRIFIKVVPSKQQVYAGEPFTVEYLLCYTTSVIDPQSEAKLKFKGCYVQEYNLNPTTAAGGATGQPYFTHVLKKFLVIADAGGPLQLPPLSLQIKVNAPPSADDFFEQERVITRKITSDMQRIRVLDLPPPPSSGIFCGAIGSNFILKNSFKPSLQNNNVLEGRLTLAGTGNLKTVGIEQPKLPLGIEIYNTQGNTTDSLDNIGLQSVYTLSYTLVAEYKNVYAIPQVNLLAFDADKGLYYTLSTQPYVWNVTTGPPLPSALKLHPAVAHVLYTNKTLDEGAESIAVDTVACLLATLSLICFAFGYSYRQTMQRKKKPAYRFITAKRNALRAVKRLNANGNKLTSEAASKQQTDILYTYLNCKNCIDEKATSIDDVARALLDKQIPDPLRREVLLFLQDCYAQRFSYAQSRWKNKQAFDELAAIIKNLETHLHEEKVNN